MDCDKNKTGFFKKSLSIFLLLIPLASGFSLPLYAQLNDPTVPSSIPLPRAAQEQKLNLTSILNAAHRRIAIINGKALSVGDIINNTTIVAINRDTVQLKRGKKAITLILTSRNIKELR